MIDFRAYEVALRAEIEGGSLVVRVTNQRVVVRFFDHATSAWVVLLARIVFGGFVQPVVQDVVVYAVEVAWYHVEVRFTVRASRLLSLEGKVRLVSRVYEEGRYLVDMHVDFDRVSNYHVSFRVNVVGEEVIWFVRYDQVHGYFVVECSAFVRAPFDIGDGANFPALAALNDGRSCAVDAAYAVRDVEDDVFRRYR